MIGDKPIVVSASARLGMIVMAIRQLALIVGGAVTLAGFLKTRDIAGLINWLRGNDFAAVATAIGTAGVFGWGQWREWRHKREALELAKHAGPAVAVVKGKQP